MHYFTSLLSQQRHHANMLDKASENVCCWPYTRKNVRFKSAYDSANSRQSKDMLQNYAWGCKARLLWFLCKK